MSFIPVIKNGSFMMSTRFVFVWTGRGRRDRHLKNSSSATRSPVSPKKGDDLSIVDIRFSVKGPNKFPLRSSMSVHERWFSPQHSSSVSSKWTLQRDITCKPTYPVARSNQDLRLRVSQSSNWSLWLQDVYSYQSSAFVTTQNVFYYEWLSEFVEIRDRY